MQRIWKWSVTASIWAGRLLIIAVVVLTLIEIRQEWEQNEVIIEPVPVPEAAARAGWTSEVMARQIRDEIRRIDRAGRTDYPHAAYGLQSKPQEPDFTLPGGTISTRTAARWIHKVISGPPKRLVAEVVALDEKDIGRQCGDSRIDASTRYQLHARLDPTSSSWLICAPTLSGLAQEAAEKTLRQTNPYRLALYFAARQSPPAQEDLDRVRAIADEMLRNDAVNQYEWALNLSGLLHTRYGREHKKKSGGSADARKEFELAVKDFERASRIKPDFSPAYINHGWVLYHLEEWDASIVQFNRSIAVHESRSIRPYSDSYNGLGFVYLKQGELDKAIANFEKAKDIEPNYIDRNNNDDPYFGLAEAWQKNGQPAKADEMRTLRECLESGLRYELCRLK